MKPTLVAFGLGLVLFTGAAAPAPTTAPAQAVGSAEAIKARQAAFILSAATFNAMKAAVDGGQPASSQAFASRGLAAWATALPGLFPAGSGAEAGVPTRAKPEIWTDRAGFEAEAAKYAEAARKLNDLARADDTAGFTTQWAVVRQSCQSCHAAYRID